MKVLTKKDKDSLKSITGRLIRLARHAKDAATKEVLGEASSLLVRLLVLRK